MTKRQLRPFIGKSVSVHWRDPQGDTSWTDKPLRFVTAKAETRGWFVGFNIEGDCIFANTTDKIEWAGIDAIPTTLIEKIEELGIIDKAK